ncbi:hypothetical protein EUTSA_v10015746mg, partial [Eutrema salsugineum]
MSSMNSKFSAADTGVFWDLDACPIPTGLGPDSISANIKLALENFGYTGKVSIFAYSVAEQSEEVKFGSAEIKLKQKLGTSNKKIRSMYLGVMFWGANHSYEPTNLM